MGFFFAKGAAASSSYDTEVLADSPVGYWRLAETSGTTAADSSGNALNGTYVNSPTLNQTGGLTGNAAVLFARASSQRVNLGTPAALNIIGQVTVECLYRPTSFPTGSVVHTLAGHGYGTNTGYILNIYQSAGNVYLQIGSFGGGSHGVSWAITGWSTGQWKHIAAGYTGTAWKIFVDGSEVATATVGTGALTSTANSAIGATDTGSFVDHADGTIDEVAVYNTWIGSTRIAAHFAAVA